MGKVSPPVNRSPNVRNNYPLRSTACLVVLSLHLTLFLGEGVSPWQWAIVIFHTLIYPHAAFYFSRTNHHENRNIYIDSFLYGFSLGLWGFNPLLMALFISSTNMTNLAAGGHRFFIKGVFLQGLGLVLGGCVIGFEYRPVLSTTAVILGTSGLVFYTFSLGLMIYNINRSLRKNKSHLSARQQDLEHINALALTVNSSLDLDVVMEGVMKTLENIYPFESLFVVSYSQNRDRLKIVGAYGAAVSEEQENAFKYIEMDLHKDKNSIFVSALENDRIINISRLTLEMVDKGGELDRALYNIKPSLSVACFPVYVENQVVAGVSFINYEKKFSLSKMDLQRISEYLVQVGTAIKNVRMFEEANQARQQAEESEKAKTRFLANMSHEIRTPMTAILGYSEALQDKGLDTAQRDNFLQTIIRSGNHLLTVINDILDISKIESSNIEVESLDVDLVSVLSDLQDYVDLNNKENSVDFNMKIHFPIPRIIKTDPTRLKQVLYNLSNNAIKFTHKGWVRIEISFIQDHMIFNVIDSGIGLNEEEQKCVFDAFIQADTSTTRLYGGTGLGLSISKSLANLMGGDLTLQSEKGKGSCFTLTTHVGDNTKDFIEDGSKFQCLMDDHKKASQVRHIPQFSGQVLVAEDNAENQILIEYLLTQAGLQVTLVENGLLAYEKCKENTFDLVLLDMQMPVMGGEESNQHIKKLQLNMPIVAFTANVMKHQVDGYLNQGFSNVLEKPINPDQLYSVLAQHLNQNFKSGTVLIVEDNVVNQKVLQRFVNKANKELLVSIASNGEEAVEMAAETFFDLILMDIEMPIMGGLEATGKLRENGFKGPIHMVSGNIDKKHKQLSLAAGANGHMAKPIDKDVLFELIYQTFNT